MVWVCLFRGPYRVINVTPTDAEECLISKTSSDPTSLWLSLEWKDAIPSNVSRCYRNRTMKWQVPDMNIQPKSYSVHWTPQQFATAVNGRSASGRVCLSISPSVIAHPFKSWLFLVGVCACHGCSVSQDVQQQHCLVMRSHQGAVGGGKSCSSQFFHTKKYVNLGALLQLLCKVFTTVGQLF